MKLYYADVLSPRKACAVAKYLQSPVDYAFVSLEKGEHRTPEYCAMNPNAKVPTLVDGDRVLWEADAIMCYLAEQAGSDLWPRDSSRQIEIIRWLSWNLQHFYKHAGALFFQHVIKARFNLGDPDPAAVEQAQDEFRRFAVVLDGHLQEHRWLVGDGLTVADFAVAVTLPYADRAHIPLGKFPAIKRWHDQLNEIEAWREPFPEMTVWS